MSKPLLQKLQKHLDDGTLFSMVDEVLAGTQLLVVLGYSPKLDRYIGIIKKFLIDNEIDISHWTTNGLPKRIIYKKKCEYCGKEFTVT